VLAAMRAQPHAQPVHPPLVLEVEPQHELVRSPLETSGTMQEPYNGRLLSTDLWGPGGEISAGLPDLRSGRSGNGHAEPEARRKTDMLKSDGIAVDIEGAEVAATRLSSADTSR
jgi:hypothetical protein